MESLNFEKLVSAYYDNLNTKLRNFGTGPAFLDSWVHDENLNRSLYGVFESAQDNGVYELAVDLSQSLSKNVDLKLLESELETFGSPSIEKTHEGYRISIRKIHPAYEKALALREKQIRFEGPLSAAIESRQGEIFLRVKLDESNKRVLEAKHQGGVGFFRPLLDVLCETLIHRPLQEGHDHALIRVEALLRDTQLTPPVKGLVSPRNCEPSFRVLEALIRGLGQPSDKRNMWVDPVSPSWRALSQEDQKAKLESLFTGTDLKVVEIRAVTRVVLSGNTFRLRKNAGHELMQLEAKAQTELEPSLEFVMESLEDKNKRETRTSI